MSVNNASVVVIGAGPVGLATAAHLQQRNIDAIVLEAGSQAGAHLASYPHVQMFSPWRLNLDLAAKAILEDAGWDAPNPDELPTAGEIVTNYLEPLAKVLSVPIVFDTKVTSISREGMDKVKGTGRSAAPFRVSASGPGGRTIYSATAVIDASGTWATPNPMGAGGLTAEGEDEEQERIAYGMPDVLGIERVRYAGKRVIVVGSGHSAAGTVQSLVDLGADAPATTVTWLLRRPNVDLLFGGGEADQLEARGDLGERLRKLVEDEVVDLRTGFAVERVSSSDGVLSVESVSGSVAHADEIIVATGSRPDWSMNRELRIDLDPWLEAVRPLAPLIDPNEHSCGTVPPHGYAELLHPEEGFYAVGAKSYGRAPNFLMATGYEQARSVVAAIDGDMDAAADVRLVLPETGVCSTDLTSDCVDETTESECCAPAAEPAAACC